jgi:hypothetical protein
MRVVPSAEHKVRGEALTVVHTGLVMSRERILIQDADAVPLSGRQYVRVRDASARAVLRGLTPSSILITGCSVRSSCTSGRRSSLSPAVGGISF